MSTDPTPRARPALRPGHVTITMPRQAMWDLLDRIATQWANADLRELVVSLLDEASSDRTPDQTRGALDELTALLIAHTGPVETDITASQARILAAALLVASYHQGAA